MRSSRILAYGIVAAALSLSACGDDDDDVIDDGTGDAGDGGDVAPAQLGNEEALALVDVANEAQIEQSQLVLQHATTAQVRALAQTLLQAHTALDATLDTSIQQLGIAPQGGDVSEQVRTRAQQRTQQLRDFVGEDGGPAPGAEAIREMERQFLHGQIALHQQLISILDTRSQRLRSEVRQLLEAARPQLLQNLRTACEVREASFDRLDVDTVLSMDPDEQLSGDLSCTTLIGTGGTGGDTGGTGGDTGGTGGDTGGTGGDTGGDTGGTGGDTGGTGGDTGGAGGPYDLP